MEEEHAGRETLPDTAVTQRRNASIVAPTKFISTTLSQTITSRRKTPQKLRPRFPLSKNQCEDLRKAFDIFDADSTGFISINELRIAIRALGYEPMKSELEGMVALVDNSGKGRIAYADFEYLMNLRMAQNDKDSDILKALYLMNGSKENGVITVDKLKQVSRELGEDLNEEELQDMLNVADINLDSFVDQKEFLAISKCLNKYAEKKLLSK